jgi:hypothetical protein
LFSEIQGSSPAGYGMLTILPIRAARKESNPTVSK